GGSSGGLEQIIAECLEKNPGVRIVVNTVTMETQTEVLEMVRKFGFDVFEAVSVNISRSRRVGRYNMMNAQNPVFVFTMQKGRKDD
ncbi:MAG: bifunctional cobalt-precorrin-7 (C(5))-methyltransferase/cobalt-precorrin-6B (C(15))-methyltransferase, partial [Oscillospiraceae bacterium]|nr:bifunctional cobalt-precorrin-7 (C(5))-methyltransferase/cobalt-precorrin-6B (C(15))-methyltransferase [Oscillospiraceae bacterium]